MTKLEDRRLDWDRCRNARDLGALPTGDGGSIRPGALIRSDNHDRLTEGGQAALRESGVGLILDVRTRREAEKYPSPFREEAFYRNLPLFDESDREGAWLVHEAADLLGHYLLTLDRSRQQVGAVVAAIADAPPGAVVVHCHAGKDRTGLVVALALSVAGVPPKAIADDYALTDECLKQHYAEELAKAPDEATRERWRALQHARPETMLATLRHLEDEYGGVEAYLLGGGVTSAQLTALRARLTTSSR